MNKTEEKIAILMKCREVGEVEKMMTEQEIEK